MSADDPQGPLIRILHGDPTTEELAALTAVLAISARPAAGDRMSPVRSEWGAHARKLRYLHRHGPGAWRANAWPTR